MKTVLFDLDGTLLPMDFERFLSAYLTSISDELVRRGYRSEAVEAGLRTGLVAVLQNRGDTTNEEAFFSSLAAHLGDGILAEKESLTEEYYGHRFDRDVGTVCGYTPAAKEALTLVHTLGMRAVLATNPFFPRLATHRRIAWAGLAPEDFSLITTYEDFSVCKPSTAYYQEILSRLGATPKDCLMIGNDTTDDLAATALGIPVFLVTDDLINRKGIDISDIPHGGYPELLLAIQRFAKDEF